MIDEDFHQRKNELFADVLLFFNKEPESFYMFPDELLKRMNEFLEESKKIMAKQQVTEDI